MFDLKKQSFIIVLKEESKVVCEIAKRKRNVKKMMQHGSNNKAGFKLQRGSHDWAKNVRVHKLYLKCSNNRSAYGVMFL